MKTITYSVDRWEDLLVGVLVFNDPDRPVNVLTPDVMSELDRTLDQITQNAPRALIVRSAKANCFIAGADIKVIENISGPDEARRLARQGQDIFSKLLALPCPSFAAIDGAALGGGLELALFCDYRVVSDNPKTLLGLPEVSLGIIPGFGGTQTLTRTIALTHALAIILAGKRLDGRQAARQKLADLCAPQDIFDRELKRFVRASTRKRPMPRRELPFSLKREIIFALAKRGVTAETRGHYPAPYAALEAIRRGLSKPFKQALEVEADVFSRLPGTDVCKNLIRTYFQTEKYKKLKSPGGDSFKPVLPVKTVVIGAGTMGAGIAYQLAARGFPVRLKDVKPEFLRKGMASAKSMFASSLKRKRISPEEARDGLNRITPSTDDAGLAGAGLVIEAAVEDLEIKKKIFAQMSKIVAPGAVLASNTSSLPVTQMAAGTDRPDKVLGLHFFNPVPRMPLVEIVVGEKTSDETLAFGLAMVKALGKTPVIVKDAPGFLVNRLLMPYLNEAAYLLQDGARIDWIDKVALRFGMPMGPLFLIDVVGLDVAAKVSHVLESAFGERMKVCELLNTLTARGELGQKSGRGFYTHAANNKRSAPNAALYAGLPADSRPDRALVEDRLMLPMVNEAAHALAAGVVASAEDVDVGMLLGTGFPPFRGGLLRWADTRGLPSIVARLDEFAAKHGPRFAPAPRLKDLAAKNKTFHS